MKTYKSIWMACSLSLASGLQVLAADTEILTDCARKAMADSTAPSAAPQWEKSLPLLALMPADVQWAVEKKMALASFVPDGRFAFGCTETQSLVDYYRVCTLSMTLLETVAFMNHPEAAAGDPELAEKMKRGNERGKALLRRIADSGRRFSVGTIYAVAEAPEGGDAALAFLAQGFGKIFSNAVALKSEPFEYKGWRGYKCDLGQSWKELMRMAKQNIKVKELGLESAQSYFDGATLYYLYRLEGSRLYLCFCDDPEKMAWVTDPSKSVLSRPIWKQMPKPDEGEVTHAFVASRKAMQEFGTSAGEVAALLSEMDPDGTLSDMVDPMISGRISAFYAAASPVLSALSGGDLGLVACKKGTGDYRGVVRTTLNEVSFGPGVLRVPQGSSEKGSVLTFACTPLKPANGALKGTLPAPFAKGATLLSFSPETDEPHETITNEVIPAAQQDASTPLQKLALPADYSGMVFSVEGWNFTKYTGLWAHHVGVLANYPPYVVDDTCLFTSFDAALYAKGGQGFIRFRLTTSGYEDDDPRPLAQPLRLRSQDDADDEADADEEDSPADGGDEEARESEPPQVTQEGQSGVKADQSDDVPMEECIARAKRQEPRAVREVTNRYAAAENWREALRWYAFAFYHRIDLYDEEDRGLIMLLTSVDDAESVLKSGGPEERLLLCYCLLEGVGLPKNEEKAFRILEEMARSGDSWGQFHLGIAYYKGEGCEKNTQEAIRWLKAAADQGNDDAREVLELVQEGSPQE